MARAPSIRERLVPYLATPRCPRELRELSGLGKKSVESALHRMRRSGWATCLTPHLRQARLYTLTFFGRLLYRELIGTSPEPGGSLSKDERALALHAWVQAGRYRRLVMAHLTEPLTARALRTRILNEYQAIGANHVHAALRSLRRRGLVERRDGRWQRRAIDRTE